VLQDSSGLANRRSVAQRELMGEEAVSVYHDASYVDYIFSWRCVDLAQSYMGLGEPAMPALGLAGSWAQEGVFPAPGSKTSLFAFVLLDVYLGAGVMNLLRRVLLLASTAGS